MARGAVCGLGFDDVRGEFDTERWMNKSRRKFVTDRRRSDRREAQESQARLIALRSCAERPRKGLLVVPLEE